MEPDSVRVCMVCHPVYPGCQSTPFGKRQEACVLLSHLSWTQVFIFQPGLYKQEDCHTEFFLVLQQRIMGHIVSAWRTSLSLSLSPSLPLPVPLSRSKVECTQHTHLHGSLASQPNETDRDNTVLLCFSFAFFPSHVVRRPLSAIIKAGSSFLTPAGAPKSFTKN